MLLQHTFHTQQPTAVLARLKVRSFFEANRGKFQERAYSLEYPRNIA